MVLDFFTTINHHIHCYQEFYCINHCNNITDNPAPHKKHPFLSPLAQKNTRKPAEIRHFLDFLDQNRAQNAIFAHMHTILQHQHTHQT